MSRYKYRFTLHQIYAFYAWNGHLKWRELAQTSHVSTRTLSNYFESVEHLEELLVDYHLKYLQNYYSKFRITDSMPLERRKKTVRRVVTRHLFCYHFSDKAHRDNLAGRGEEIMSIQLQYIERALAHGGAKPEKLFPEMAFHFFLAPLPDDDRGDQFFSHMMDWFMQPFEEEPQQLRAMAQ